MLARQKASVAIIIAAALTLGAWVAWPSLKTLAFLFDMAGRTGVLRALIPVHPLPVTTEDLSAPTRHGAVLVRLYRPSPPATGTVVVFPGMHGGGVDEPRLITFSRRLAASGLNVLSAPLPDLREYRITGRSTDEVEDIVAWAADAPRFASHGRVGVFGVSVAGGLAIVATGRPRLAGRVSVVLSLGGHGDLGRVLHFLCTGRLPDGTPRAPHDYGLAIVTLAAAPSLVPDDDASALERAVRTYLDASLDESPDQHVANQRLDDARRQTDTMRPPARQVMTWVNDHDLVALGRALEPHVDAIAADARLSPERSPAPDIPVFLLHGTEDNVIPSTETPQLADYLARHGNPHVHWLLTPVLSHMGVDADVSLVDRGRLMRFWRDLRAYLP